MDGSLDTSNHSHHLNFLCLNSEFQNPCFWLLKSPETDAYDMHKMAKTTDWDLWEGRVKPYVNVVVSCNDCEEHSLETCNYNGVCGSIEEYKCECNDGFFGSHCEFLRPCDVIRCEFVNDSRHKLSSLYQGLISFFTSAFLQNQLRRMKMLHSH